MKTTNYVFKYDKNKNLYNYIEKDSKSNLNSYYAFNYKTNSLVKYDSVNKLRVFNQFEFECKLTHKFEGGESWVRPVLVSDDSYSLTYPKIKKQFALNSENQIVRFSIQHQLLEQWK